MSLAKSNPTSHRWATELADFRFKVKYHPVSLHKDADFFHIYLWTFTILSRSAVTRHLCQQLKLLVMQSLLRRIIISVGFRHSPTTQRLCIIIPSKKINWVSNPFDEVLFKHTKRVIQLSLAFSSISLFKEILRKRIVRMSQVRLKHLCENGKISLLVRMVYFIGQTSQLVIPSQLKTLIY